MALEDEEPPKTIITSHSSSSSSSSEQLPSEIIFKILSSLPVESLLRCKSVCKSWHSLISDRHFIKHHLALSTTNNHYGHHHLLVLSVYPLYILNSFPLYDVLYDRNPIGPVEVDYPMKNPHKSVSIIGSCNGLICIEIYRDNLFLWNPSTRKFIQLPDCPLSDYKVGYGFGYIESADDYRVVEIVGDKNVVMVYSSRYGNWKDIGPFPYSVLRKTKNKNVFLNGALHWIAVEYDGSWLESIVWWRIVSLDLAKETYSESLLPVDEDDDIDLSLGIVGDCLCVFCDYGRDDRPCVDVWVMKVYGVKDSWFKLVSIPYDEQYCDEGNYILSPVCVSDDGKVLMQFRSWLTVFDSKNDSTIDILSFSKYYQACTFVESLVSPAGHDT